MTIKYGVLNEELINVINLRSKMDGDGQVFVPKEPIPTKSVLIKTDKPRPYVCMVCTRAFARAEHLKRHERAHTKEKPFSCSSCGRNFSRKDLLLRHKQKLHAIIPIPEKKTKATTGPTKVGKKAVAHSPPEKKRDGTPYSNYSPPDSVYHSRQVSVDSSIEYLNESRFSSFSPRGQVREPEVNNTQNSYTDQFLKNADFASLTPAYYDNDTFETNDQLMTDSNDYETTQHGITEHEHMNNAPYAHLWDIYNGPLPDGNSRIPDTHRFPQAQHYPQPTQGQKQGPNMQAPLNTSIKQDIGIQPQSIELQASHTHMNPANATNTDAENAKPINPSPLRNTQEFPTISGRTNGEFQSEARKAKSQTRSARSSSFNASSATTYLKKKDVSLATPETAPLDAEQHAVEFSTPQLLAIDESPFQIEDIDAICLEPGIDHIYQDQFGNFTDPNNQFQLEIDLNKFNLSSMNSPHSSGSVYPMKDPHMFLNNLHFAYNTVSPIEGANSGLHTNLMHSNDHEIYDHDQHHAHNSAANEPPKC